MPTKVEFITLHVKVDRSWYDLLRNLADESEGSVHSQVKLAIRERLQRTKLLKNVRLAKVAAQ